MKMWSSVEVWCATNKLPYKEYVAHILKLTPTKQTISEELYIAIAELANQYTLTKAALDEGFSKTKWAQQTAKAVELGRHRADVLKERIMKLTNGI